ncbi:MAG: glycosyltransferase family 9 protein [Planctomycetota bacterium]|jgi:lipopolysaccharide heptosyltransferase I
MKDNPRILILRMSAAGDIIHGSPVAHALREAYPNATIAWLVEDRFENLLKENPDIDERIVVPRKAWREWSLGRRAGAILDRIKHIRGLRFDVTLDLQGLTKSALPGFLSGAKQRIGFDGRDGRELSRFLNTTLIQSTATHVVDKNLELLRPLGIEAPTAFFPVPQGRSERVEAFLSQNGLTPGEFSIINPGAGWEAKRWALDRFGVVGQGLTQHTGNKAVVTWGGPQEQKMAEAIVDAGGQNCIMAPDTDLRELWLLLAQARIMVSSDTGPLHMAAAADVPTVALFGPTVGARNGPYGPSHEIVQGACPNHPLCWRKRHRAACRCMETITPDQVLEACRRILET